MKVCERKEDQVVWKVIEIFDRKYWRSRLEKIEECVQNWLEFKESDFETEDELLFAMEEVGNRKNELKMLDAE